MYDRCKYKYIYGQNVCMHACMHICILYKMCLSHCQHEPQGHSVLCSELGHIMVDGPAHGSGGPPANPKLAHLGGGGVKTEIW